MAIRLIIEYAERAMTLLTPPSSTRFTPQDLLAMPDNNGLELVRDFFPVPVTA